MRVRFPEVLFTCEREIGENMENLVENGKNKLEVRCKHCESVVLKPLAADYIEKVVSSKLYFLHPQNKIFPRPLSLICRYHQPSHPQPTPNP